MGGGGARYQEKHSLLQAFSRQFAETAQPDELLRKAEQKERAVVRLQSEPAWLKVLSIRLLTRPGTTRLSMPIKSFFSSKSFWKFSILIKLPWSCSTTSDTSARAATTATRQRGLWEKGCSAPAVVYTFTAAATG